MAVNVAAEQLCDPSFPDLVRSVLEETGFPGRSLELEVSEAGLIEHLDDAVSASRALGALGVRLAIDDFGNGGAAPSYLERIEVDVLKIDRTLVRDLTTHPINATITESIVRLAGALQLSTVAGGVETREQLLLLDSYGCTRMQGFLFGKPSPPDVFGGWLETPPLEPLPGAGSS
jgi:EAL domain-containing protein (putative c-di-GMP-specific phosphodiesterase class I)